MVRPPLRPLALAVLLAPLAACATASRVNVGPLVTDRPDFTESSETVDRGLVQLESGGTFSRDGDERAGSFGEALFRVGIAERTELRVGLNSYAISRVSGSTSRVLEDASLGAKVKLLQGGDVGSARPTVAVIVASSLPTGASPFRSNKLQPEIKLTGAWDLTERVAFSTNLNHAWVRERFESYGESSATASFGIGVTERVGSYVEYYGFFPRFDGAERTHFANGGLTYGFTDDLQLDGRIGSQLGRRADGPSYFVGLGISRRW
jgi:hypothetical protein